MGTYQMRFAAFSILISCAATGWATEKSCDDISQRSDASNIALIKKCLLKHNTTKSTYFDSSTGKYSQIRQALQQRIIDETIAHVECSQKPVALFTGGLPGSGKTTFLKTFFPEIYAKNRFAIVNADDFKERLPEYQAWNADLFHPESSDMTRLALSQLTSNRACKRNFVYDGTFRDSHFYEKLTHDALALDYKIHVVYVKTPSKIAAERVLRRFNETGRFCSNVPTKETARRSLGNLKRFIENRLYTGVTMIDGVTQTVECRSGENFMQMNGSARTCEDYFRILEPIE